MPDGPLPTRDPPLHRGERPRLPGAFDPVGDPEGERRGDANGDFDPAIDISSSRSAQELNLALVPIVSSVATRAKGSYLMYYEDQAYLTKEGYMSFYRNFRSVLQYIGATVTDVLFIQLFTDKANIKFTTTIYNLIAKQ